MTCRHCIVNVLLMFCVTNIAAWQTAFSTEFYENVLNFEECERQLDFIRNNDTSLLRIRFLDASWRIPRSLLKGNNRDMGNYFQCLDIKENIQDLNIEGKYCAVQFPVDQENFELPTIPPPSNIISPDDWNSTWSDIRAPPSLSLPWTQIDTNSIYTEEMRMQLATYEEMRQVLRELIGGGSKNKNSARADALLGITFELAICLPKVCTTRQALDFFSNNLTSFLTFEEDFCRLPDDKPWAPVDTVAVVIFSVIGLLTLLSTAYDIWYTLLLKIDSKTTNKIYQSFSVYTNTKNFFFFPSGPGIVTCLDGIRTFAMLWVIIGHSFSVPLSFIPENPVEMLSYMMEVASVWLTSASITVETFFTISGILVVYTTASKVSRISLIKNLHFFYLNRLLRMFPILAFGILMTASFLYRTADGPYFGEVATMVNNCRSHWWSTLLYIQNFYNPLNVCMPHSWYLAIDMQLYALSPLILYWVLGNNKRSAWLALVISLLCCIIAASIYNFIHDFPSAVISVGRPHDRDRHSVKFYSHTLPRAAPFFVGMIFGYLLHIYRTKTLKMPMVLAVLFWILAFFGIIGVILIHYVNIQLDWDNQLMDNIINSYQRPIWAASVGWMIFANHNGYGGPINWFLSLHIFKIISRLSYAMYVLHYPLMYLLTGTTLKPIYFAMNLFMYRFFTDLFLTLIASFVVTIVIDSPFTNLIKIGMGGGRK